LKTVLRTGSADLILHPGKAPYWLLSRMKRLGGHLLEYVVDEHGPREVLVRLSHPVYFQSLSNLLAFDWNSSGSTTVLCGVLKAIFEEHELGLSMAGGKGQRLHRLGEELHAAARAFDMGEDDVERMRYAGRLAAKVDNAAVQDGFNLYHQAFFLESGGEWAVVQQGMDAGAGLARRYHWHSRGVEDFTEEPHLGIASQASPSGVLDMTARESRGCRGVTVELTGEPIPRLRRLVRGLSIPGQSRLALSNDGGCGTETGLVSPAGDLSGCPSYSVSHRLNWLAIERAHGLGVRKFEDLLEAPGVGPATVRALALVAEMAHGASPCYRDPARYSFAFGGKDGVPFPVLRTEYDRAADFFEDAVSGCRAGREDYGFLRERLVSLQRCLAV